MPVRTIGAGAATWANARERVMLGGGVREGTMSHEVRQVVGSFEGGKG